MCQHTTNSYYNITSTSFSSWGQVSCIRHLHVQQNDNCITQCFQCPCKSVKSTCYYQVESIWRIKHGELAQRQLKQSLKSVSNNQNKIPKILNFILLKFMNNFLLCVNVLIICHFFFKYFNSEPDKKWCLCSRELSKVLWKTLKMPMMANLSFSRSI